MRRLLAMLAAGALVLSTPAASAQPPSSSSLTRLCSDYLARTITVEALGDSVVRGAGATSDERTWVHRLARVLEPGAVWVGANHGSAVVDYLPGGIYYAHTQFTRDVRPTVVLWDWRINDQYLFDHNDPRGSSPVQLRDRFVALAQHIRQASPTTTVLIINPPKVIAPGWPPATEQAYVSAMWEAKTLIPDALWLDLALYSPNTVAQNDAGLMHADGIHQADAGHALTAAAVHQRLHSTCAR